MDWNKISYPVGIEIGMIWAKTLANGEASHAANGPLRNGLN